MLQLIGDAWIINAFRIALRIVGSTSGKFKMATVGCKKLVFSYINNISDI